MPGLSGRDALLVQPEVASVAKAVANRQPSQTNRTGKALSACRQR